jgi:light-regulated signal transduction histidine kinase (bacteriophytochrome)
LTDPPLAGGAGNATELGNCEREPIRIPGSIQPHGALLVLAKDDRTVIQVSENAAAMLRRSPSELLGSSLDQLLGGQTVERLAIELHQVPGQGRPLLLGTLAIDEAGAIGTAGAIGEPGDRRQFHLLAHRSDGQLVLELEADDSGSADSAATIHRQRLVDAPGPDLPL